MEQWIKSTEQLPADLLLEDDFIVEKVREVA
jgi:hypothetical protein